MLRQTHNKVGWGRCYQRWCPRGHIWDVMLVLRKGNIEKKLSVLCTIIMVHNVRQVLTGWSTVYWALILLGLALCFPSASVSSVFVALYIYLTKFLLTVHPSLYFLVSWAWWDWPLIWLTNHRPSVLWHYWLGNLTCKIVPEMTYKCVEWDVKPYYTILYRRQTNTD